MRSVIPPSPESDLLNDDALDSLEWSNLREPGSRSISHERYHKGGWGEDVEANGIYIYIRT